MFFSLNQTAQIIDLLRTCFILWVPNQLALGYLFFFFFRSRRVRTSLRASSLTSSLLRSKSKLSTPRLGNSEEIAFLLLDVINYARSKLINQPYHMYRLKGVSSSKVGIFTMLFMQIKKLWHFTISFIEMIVNNFFFGYSKSTHKSIYNLFINGNNLTFLDNLFATKNTKLDRYKFFLTTYSLPETPGAEIFMGKELTKNFH